MLATTGPWIDLVARDGRGRRRAGIGQTLRPRDGRVVLELGVAAVPWIPVDEVRIYANGELVQRYDATTTPAVHAPLSLPWEGGPADVPRFEAEIELDLEADAWVLVEAGEALDPMPAPDPFADQIVPGLIPFAFTNPIFVDLEGDGFDAPGVGD